MVPGHREIKLELSWKLLHYWLSFIAPEGAMQTARREKSSTVLAAMNLENCNIEVSGKMCIDVNSITVMGVSTF